MDSAWYWHCRSRVLTLHLSSWSAAWSPYSALCFCCSESLFRLWFPVLSALRWADGEVVTTRSQVCCEAPSPLSGLRAVHVVAGLNPADGGPSYTVPRLCEALSQAGVRTTLLSVAKEGDSACHIHDAGYHDR